MVSMPPSEENRWINPRRPLTATPQVNGKLAGGERHSSRALHRPGALPVRCPLTAMTNGSRGLAGGGHPQTTPVARSESALPFTHPLHPNAAIPDQYWIGGGRYGWLERLGAESDDEEMAPDSMLEDLSISDLTKVWFPCPMEGEQWEAAVKEAEKELKEKGFTWTETDDDGPRKL